MLSYCLKVTLSLISSPRFRNTVSGPFLSADLSPVTLSLSVSLSLPSLLKVLQVLVRIYLELETPDYISVCQVMM